MNEQVDRLGTGYRAGRSGATFWRVPEPGWLHLTGPDRNEYVQRQTTNDIRQLQPGRTQLTVLTSGTARILDVWRLVPEDDALGVITLPGRGPATARYLQRRIFFMDHVSVLDASDTLAQFDLLGPAAPDVLAALGLKQVPEPGALVGFEVAGVEGRALGPEPALNLGWRLLIPVEAAGTLEARLRQGGAEPLAPDAYDVLRVEAGLPAAGHELTDAYTPLETGLRAAIAGAKGCYSGQEVIARQINYDKITRQLAGLRLDAPVAPGATVRVEGRSAGEVTSAVVSPAFGPIALAVMKRPHFEPETAITVVREGGDVRGVVCALPFA